jgi:UrcA family protein
MNTSIRLRTLCAAAVFGALASSIAALCAAAESTDTPTVIVKYGDLNVANPQGAAALYNRIVAAAHQVCKSFDNDSRGLGSRPRQDACIHKATADAVSKVGKPELFAIYNAKNRQPLPIVVASAQTL